jgi:TolB-like protein/tetratricopeptide (TPR) repeat protein
MADAVERLKAALADRYRIERELGAGGMATVYLAEDLKHHRQVAIKVLRPDLSASLGAERFLREVGIAARLSHPHILGVHDSGEADGFLYYVMPYVEGISLRQKLQREGELPIPEAVRILRDLADALAYAHRQSVVHRDIKPENVMLVERHALVMDFGVAKALAEGKERGSSSLTSAGVALGTPAYMAPEQASGEGHVDHRADLYAWGVVAYELLAGQPPFVRATAQNTLAAQVTATPEPVTHHRANVPGTLARLVMQCLEKKPADRPQTAEEVLRQLETGLTPSGGMTPTDTRTHQTAATRLAWRRKTVPILAGAAVVLAGVVGGALYLSKDPVAGAEGGTVAVLPLTSRSADSSDVLLGEGLADAVGALLSRVPSLQVLSTTALRTMQTRVPAPLDAARALKARWVVAGTLRRSEGGLTAAVEVIRASSGIQRWSWAFRKTMANMISLDTEIAESVATVLAGAHGLARTTNERVGTADPEAHNLYLLGRASVARRTEASVQEAVRYFSRAVAVDSTYAPAWAALGSARVVQFSWANWRADVPRGSLLTLAGSAIDRALRLDSMLADAWQADGSRATWMDDFSRAKNSLERAIQLDSLRPEAWAALGHMYGAARLSQPDSAARMFRRAISLDPSLQNYWRGLASQALLTGRLREAEAVLDTVIGLGDWAPGYSFRAEVRFYRGNSSGALEDLAMSERLRGQRDEYSEALYRIAAGDRGPARAWLNQHPLDGLGTPPTGPEEILIHDVARMNAALGWQREALEALGRLPPSVGTWAELHGYAYHALRRDPEFQRLLDQSRPAFLSKP